MDFFNIISQRKDKVIYRDGDKVVKGQKVSKGDVIGAVSVTNRQEYKDGAHIHFEVSEKGVTIDPAKYMDISEK